MVLSLQRKRWSEGSSQIFLSKYLSHMGYGSLWQGTITTSDNFCFDENLSNNLHLFIKLWYLQGTLSEGRAIVVKQLSVTSHQGKSQFIAEISTISSVQHRNLVKLYGCCIEGAHRLLVYEYLEHRSLDQALFGKSGVHLSWPTQYEICLGAARDLAYLHEESRPRIVHRDVKASNIISDFRLAKLYDDKKTHISTRVAGTIGYLGPEYAMLGHLTEKADVYGFGVVALEIVSGRPNADTTLDQDKMYLLGWVSSVGP
ncbi:hypothetical protein C5167_026960 [Papaver somniferum]|nr:hypothetical protein C5167_026960 [Papaver somniferum]